MVDDFTCDNGCPTDMAVYRLPPPGEYTLVHFAADGVTTDDARLGIFDGLPALVSTLRVE